MTDSRLTSSMARLLAVLEPHAVVTDLYSERGSEVYDAMTRGDDSEVREILRVGRRTGGRILELACGSGRLTVALGRLRRETVALDNSPRMLELLEGRAQRAGVTVLPVLGDMSAFEVDGSFGLIVLAATSITLLPPHRRRTMLEAVRAHLSPDGVFLVSVHSTGTYTGGAETRLVPLNADPAEIVILDEQVDSTAGHRDVSVLHLRRQAGVRTTEAFASRVNLLDETQLRAELSTAGLRVRDAFPVRLADGSQSLSMLECVR
ncbi:MULTISPECIES: daptide-type RiPP biosynthesis methyltransferase [unclassified Microbacterium]|uniref:daptide-type RiPP biosynthesis methyltransferase n=1 Tax=unclassified Microbacterium TaxID=2609290 RepID=UPI00068FCAC7|nr:MULTISPECIES: daptide-type RiPP biosynthesis methyltransferase [unclassified Microbacterium]